PPVANSANPEMVATSTGSHSNGTSNKPIGENKWKLCVVSGVTSTHTSELDTSSSFSQSVERLQTRSGAGRVAAIRRSSGSTGGAVLRHFTFHIKTITAKKLNCGPVRNRSA